MHGPPKIISGIGEIAEQYDAVLCDAWGVIHNGRELFPGVENALTRFRQERGPVIIITNAPRLNTVIPDQLRRIGLADDAYDGIVTSGDATRAEIAARQEMRFFKLGPDKDETLFESLPVKFAPLEDAEIILCTGLFDDVSETPEDYRPMLEGAAARGLPMICANPDRVVKFGDRVIYCAGALADIYEAAGGDVIFGGKPHRPIYDQCRALLDNLGHSAKSVLAIGDGVQTDILGANNEGIDVAFVADGIFSEASRGPDGLDATKLASLLESHGVHAQFGLDGLRW